MKLLVGLGNPGPKYETTRHNAGFLILDEIASRQSINVDQQKFQALLGKGRLLGDECIFIKPLTFMNLSGKSVAAALRFFKIDVADTIVLHDDIDVPFGKVKARTGGGHGGHNGIRSIIAETGQADFHRIKLGVGRPQQPEDGTVVNWVLNPFTTDELATVQSTMVDDVLVRLKTIFEQRLKS
ncbi:MAG: aminoacyl-tRNA hydrolase [Oligoflexus sp.]